MGFFSRRIQKTCLNPNFSLRIQMFLSFGITAAIAISAFILVGLNSNENSGQRVKEKAKTVLEEGIKHSLGRSAQYVAETMAKKFHNIGGAGSLIAQATADRFVGYPSMEGWEDDVYVPFLNIDTNNRTYPINAEPLPLDWNTTGNIDSTNYEEHLPYRPFEWYFEGSGVSSIHGAYFMRGACDPRVTDPSHPKYYPDCTEENNNLTTGGKLKPTDTNYHIANKAKDLVWLLKPLYESHLDVKTVGIFFANDGAGSTVRYPGSAYDGRGSYTSIGCEWMSQIHPLTNQSVGTPEQIARCHKNGTNVKMREYNPLERTWCKEQVEREIALRDGGSERAQMNIMATGPYLDAFNIENIWVMTFGQAVFDILTNEFIACTLVDVSIALLYDMLTQATDVGKTAKAALIRWDDPGTVIVASNWDPKVESTTAYVTDADLQLGVDAATYQKIRSMVNYDSEWDANDVLKLYDETILEAGTKLIMMHPVPSIPKVYNALYRPEYFIIISMEESEAYGVLQEVDKMIAVDTQASKEYILMVGGIGFGVILFFIAVISGNLTKPLRWMQKVSGTIVDSCGGPDMGRGLINDLDPDEAKPVFWGPRTEVTLLLSEFVKMIHEFSGEGASEVAGAQVNEVKNDFEWRKMYAGLYPWGEPEDEPDNPGGIPKQLSILKFPANETFDDELTTESTQHTDRSILSLLSSSVANSVANSKVGPNVDFAISRTTSILQSVKEYAVMAGAKAGILKEPEEEKIRGPPKVHLGENIKQPKDVMKDYFEGVDSAHNSYLFWWTTFFIGAPIVVAAIMILVAVTRDATESIPKWLEDVKQTSIDIELAALMSAAKNRAAYGEEVMHRFARDLHVYTRLAGWLLFDGLTRANSMTFQVSGNEECKVYNSSENETCPFSVNDTLTPCAKAWDDPWPGVEGKVFNDTHPRYLQHRWYNGPSSDANAVGDRFSTSWPDVDYSPETTNWWNDTSAVPGSFKGDSASGYETTYDRMRVSSALSVADFPIYNYYPGKDEQRLLGSYVGWEFDGMFSGASGCMYWENAAFFESNEESGAYKINSTLCPKGRFGYDSRCRSWYKASYKKAGRIHITSPYLFAQSTLVGMSAGAALIDPRTGVHVGVSLIDFSPGAFLDAVDVNNTAIGQGSSGFPIVITPEPDPLGSDTLVGPGFVYGEDTASITELLLPDDDINSTNWLKFNDDVLTQMRAGETKISQFNRTTSGGQEELYVAFAPVYLRSQVAVNPSLFSAGTISYFAPVYALGFGITLDDLEIRFQEIEDTDDAGFYISLALIIGAVLMVMYMTYTMTIYLAEPILCLVGIVQMISNKTVQDELPKLEGGSCEIQDVYDSLEKLCKIVRFSNAAYFRGDRTKSYKVLEEALELFIDMENQKAMGVANNNLGTMVLQEQMEKSSETARSEKAYLAGMKYFDEAIRIGTFEYQNADFDDLRGDYVKQLANRYFNRGMFQIVNRHHKPSYNAEENGVKDLKRAKALDQEAFLYWRERDQLVQQARNEFFCTLRRARGMMTLVQVCEFEDMWGIEQLINAANEMLHDPDYATSSSLFENVNMVARRQQVDDLRIQYALLQKDTLTAATMAMKILVEDEYVIDTVLMNCVTTLNTHFNLHGAPNEVPQLAKGVKRETRRGQVDSMREAKNVVFCLDYSGSMAGERMQRANSNLLWIYEEHCLDKDYVGFCRFNHAVDDKLYFGLARKGGNQDQHMEIIGKALDAEGGTRLYAALHRCVNMITENDNPRDTWIIALTDGESAWDFPAKQVIGRIDKHNKKGGPKIHVVIIGFEVPSQVADSVATITSITDKSLYIDARGGLDEMDNAFEQVAAVITGTATTMETF